MDQPSDFLAGSFWGSGYEAAKTTARSRAIARLYDFFASLTLQIPMDQEPARTFKIPRKNMHAEQPPAAVEARDLPAIGTIPGEGTRDCSMVDIDDDTIDKYGPNTALVDLGWYEEDFQIEVWCANKAERSAIKGGLEGVFYALAEAAMLRLTLPDYFDQIATYDLLGSQDVDDDMTIQNRRRAMLRVHLTVPVTMRIDLGVPIIPLIEVDVIDPRPGAILELKAEIEARRK